MVCSKCSFSVVLKQLSITKQHIQIMCQVNCVNHVSGTDHEAVKIVLQQAEALCATWDIS